MVSFPEFSIMNVQRDKTYNNRTEWNAFYVCCNIHLSYVRFRLDNKRKAQLTFEIAEFNQFYKLLFILQKVYIAILVKRHYGAIKVYQLIKTY